MNGKSKPKCGLNEGINQRDFAYNYSTLLFLGFDNEIVVCVSTETET